MLSTAEVESALVEHEAVAEAAVVGRPHPVKGESLYCFVTLNDGINYNQKLEAELKKQGMCASMNGSCKNCNSVTLGPHIILFLLLNTKADVSQNF